MIARLDRVFPPMFAPGSTAPTMLLFPECCASFGALRQAAGFDLAPAALLCSARVAETVRYVGSRELVTSSEPQPHAAAGRRRC